MYIIPILPKPNLLKLCITLFFFSPLYSMESTEPKIFAEREYEIASPQLLETASPQLLIEDFVPKMGLRLEEVITKKQIELAINKKNIKNISVKKLKSVQTKKNKTPLLMEPYPTVLTQLRNDCVIHSVASSLEYLTYPRDTGVVSDLLPLRISRSGLYSLALYRGYSNCEDYKKRSYQSWQADLGIDFGTTLLAVDKMGVFPEQPIIIKEETYSYPVPGWGYDLFGVPIAPDVIALGLDEDLDGINNANEDQLIKNQIILKKDTCQKINYYARISRSIQYEPIEVLSNGEKLRQSLEGYFYDNKPVIIGTSVNQNFMNAAKFNGLIQNSPSKSQDFHAILALGFKDHPNSPGCVYVQNSWGTGWGVGGRGFLTWDYFKENFCGGYVISLPGFFEPLNGPKESLL